MELCDEDLRKILDRYKPNGLPLNIINIIFYQLNEALKAMRAKNFTHQDLKPENILIKYSDKNKISFDIKLTDFGLSTNEINSTINTFSKAGTPLYWAPEVENLQYNNQCDLWSLGVILYELYTNKYIFEDNTKERTRDNWKNGIIKNEIDNEMINKLIKNLIQIDNTKRIKWEEYFNDVFFDKFGKEHYPNGTLKFEGEYLNGKKWNGKGFNINNEKVYEIKEGNGLVKEYINEIVYKIKDGNGKVKEYNYLGELEFEGEYINGERNGKGKEYDYMNGDLEFEGEY